MASNYDERRAEIDKRQQAERERLDREHALLITLPEDLGAYESMAHLSGLWDRAGSLHFKTQRYESLRKGRPDPTLAPAVRLADVYAPVPLAIFRDGCVSVRTHADADKAEERAQARMAEGHTTSATVTPIAPFWITFEAARYSGEMAIHFIGQTPIGLIEMKVEYPIHSKLASKIGRVMISYSERACAMNDYKPQINSADLRVEQAVHVLGNAKAEVLRFGLSEDRREPGLRLLYWDVCGDVGGDVPTLRTLAEAVGEEVATA